MLPNRTCWPAKRYQSTTCIYDRSKPDFDRARIDRARKLTGHFDRIHFLRYFESCVVFFSSECHTYEILLTTLGQIFNLLKLSRVKIARVAATFRVTNHDHSRSKPDIWSCKCKIFCVYCIYRIGNQFLKKINNDYGWLRCWSRYM